MLDDYLSMSEVDFARYGIYTHVGGHCFQFLVYCERNACLCARMLQLGSVYRCWGHVAVT